jgi:hypothetical protein
LRSRRPGIELLVAAGLLLLGAATWQVVQMTECEGEGAARDRTAALDGYCDLKLHFLALLMPGAVVVAGAIVARRRPGSRVFQAAVALAAALALSPIAAAVVLG